MKFFRFKHVFHPISIFVVAQISWGLLMVVWIRWYVVRTNELDKVFMRLSNPDQFETGHWIVLWAGCLLMGVILAGLYLIFVNLRRQVKLNKLQDSILNSVTHELKTPLASIRLYTETMLLRDLQSSDREKFFHKILREADRLQTQIDRILVMARQESTTYRDTPTPIQLSQTLGYCVQKAQERVGDSRVFEIRDNTLHSSDHNNAPLIFAPPLIIEVLFDNLVENAVKYSEKGGEITVIIEATATHVKVSVQDDGIGLEKSHLKKIFQKFYRVEDKTRSRISGSGLGLYVCQSIMKSLGGKLSATSEGLNKGASFHAEFKRYYSSH
jgi:signal transduction histidine kinase